MEIAQNVTVLGAIEIDYSYHSSASAAAVATKLNTIFTGNPLPQRVKVSSLLDAWVWGESPTTGQLDAAVVAFNSQSYLIPTLGVSAVSFENNFVLTFMRQGLADNAFKNAAIENKALIAKQGQDTEETPFSSGHVYVTIA